MFNNLLTNISPGVLQGTLLNYYKTVLATEKNNLLVYYPLNDASGTSAVNNATAREVNLVKTSGFEHYNAGFPSWVITNGTLSQTKVAGEFHSGYSAAKIVFSAASFTFYQTVNVIVGKKYRLKFWVRGDGTNQISYRIARADWGAYIISTTATGVTGTSYQQIISAEFTVPTGYAGQVHIWFSGPTGASGGSCYIDDVELIPSENSASYLDGLYVGAVLGQTGKKDKSIYLDGSNGKGIKLDDNNGALSNLFPKHSGTILCWGKPDLDSLTDGLPRFLWKFKTETNSTVANYMDAFKDAVNNKMGFQFKDDGMSSGTYDIFTKSDNEWDCLAATWSLANGLKLFKNGVKIVDSQAISGDWYKGFNYSHLVIGTETNSLLGTWKGYIENFAMWDKELTEAQILRLGK